MVKSAVNQDEFFTPRELARMLKISERTVRSMIEREEIRATKLGTRMRRIPRAEVLRLGGLTS